MKKSALTLLKVICTIIFDLMMIVLAFVAIVVRPLDLSDKDQKWQGLSETFSFK